MAKDKDFYEELIEKILKTDFEKEQKIEMLNLFKDGMERVNCMNIFANCPYGVNIDRHFKNVLAKCNFSGEKLGFPSDSEIDKRFYGGCPYNKLYTKCEEHIKRISK